MGRETGGYQPDVAPRMPQPSMRRSAMIGLALLSAGGVGGAGIEHLRQVRDKAMAEESAHQLPEIDETSDGTPESEVERLTRERSERVEHLLETIDAIRVSPLEISRTYDLQGDVPGYDWKRLDRLADDEYLFQEAFDEMVAARTAAITPQIAGFDTMPAWKQELELARASGSELLVETFGSRLPDVARTVVVDVSKVPSENVGLIASRDNWLQGYYNGVTAGRLDGLSPWNVQVAETRTVHITQQMAGGEAAIAELEIDVIRISRAGIPDSYEVLANWATSEHPDFIDSSTTFNDHLGSAIERDDEDVTHAVEVMVASIAQQSLRDLPRESTTE